ncbi:hypothetical protein [Synechococcus sp. GFB01]|uniref:hypothetical protein n=1 Tax=Synechococcus sp. GFB01 TaxID=1662190 RepID=UPI00064F7C3E|nr:hypothetical protein [Synechococcus sp. GFB01]KMM17690.1 hypothetical protein SYNGFB01_02570 [Synechococcus sp. GFB01]
MLQPPMIPGPGQLEPSAPSPAAQATVSGAAAAQPQDPVLCSHCGRTASNGISCEGYCVADSGY